MMKVYKLTDAKFQTFNETQWGEGVEHIAPGEGELCGPGWLHAYEDPRIAILINPNHGNFHHPILWEADGDVGIWDGPLKLGCTRLKTIRQMELPKITMEQRVRFAIECAKQVCYDKAWNEWADKWISGEDRSGKAARAAKAAAWTSDWAETAAWAAARAATRAAEWAAAMQWSEAWDSATAWAAVWAANVAAEEAETMQTSADDKTFNIYAAMEKAGLVLNA